MATDQLRTFLKAGHVSQVILLCDLFHFNLYSIYHIYKLLCFPDLNFMSWVYRIQEQTFIISLDELWFIYLFILFWTTEVLSPNPS